MSICSTKCKLSCAPFQRDAADILARYERRARFALLEIREERSTSAAYVSTEMKTDDTEAVAARIKADRATDQKIVRLPTRQARTDAIWDVTASVRLDCDILDQTLLEWLAESHRPTKHARALSVDMSAAPPSDLEPPRRRSWSLSRGWQAVLQLRKR